MATKTPTATERSQAFDPKAGSADNIRNRRGGQSPKTDPRSTLISYDPSPEAKSDNSVRRCCRSCFSFFSSFFKSKPTRSETEMAVMPPDATPDQIVVVSTKPPNEKPAAVETLASPLLDSQARSDQQEHPTGEVMEDEDDWEQVGLPTS